MLAFVAAVVMALGGPEGIPPHLLGRWTVGAPYELGQPSALDAAHGDRIRKLRIGLSKEHIEVCGKVVPVKSVRIETLTQAQFLDRYNFPAKAIGLTGPRVTEIDMNEFASTNACGDFADPGTHLFTSNGKVVMEVANDYFRLLKH